MNVLILFPLNNFIMVVCVFFFYLKLLLSIHTQVIGIRFLHISIKKSFLQNIMELLLMKFIYYHHCFNEICLAGIDSPRLNQQFDDNIVIKVSHLSQILM